MGLDVGQLQLLVVSFGTALGTSIGAQLVNARQRRTIDKVVEKKSEPLTVQNADQEARLQTIEAYLFKFRPREGAPPNVPEDVP